MKYCNLKLVYNININNCKAGVKSTALKNCAGNYKKNTPWQTKPHRYQKLMEHKLPLAVFIVTKSHLGKVCIFLPILLK